VGRVLAGQVSDVDTGRAVSRIIVERRMEADGSMADWFEACDADGDPLPLVETLGMLRLAEDTAIRAAMGEISGEDDDD
jgi:hypothetical protein